MKRGRTTLEDDALAMTNFPLHYDWRGHLVECEIWEGPVDLSGMIDAPESVDEGETVVRMEFAAHKNGDPVWIPLEHFEEVAEPVGVDALKHEGEWPPGDGDD